MKYIISLLLIITMVATVYICVTRPTMHKSVLVYDSGYTISQEEITTVEEYEYPEMTQVQTPATEKVTVNEKIDNQIAQEEAQTTYYTASKQSPKTTVTTQVQTVAPNKTEQRQSVTRQQVQQPAKQTSTKVAQTTTQNTTGNTVPFVPTQTQTSNPVTATQTTVPQTTHTQSAPTGHTKTTTVAHAPVGNTNVSIPKLATTSKPVTQTTQPKVLTAQEEEIAWNKWRSNLQNRIMKDSRLPNMPLGTVFKFSFSVDKYGKVTNVKTYSTDPKYTPYAIQYIAPTIRSYQGHSILNFPVGSNRVITDVTGSWRISTSATYSTPNDYNDIEKVTK